MTLTTAQLDAVKVGDLKPRLTDLPGDLTLGPCRQRGPGPEGFLCTLVLGHESQHIASGSVEVYEVWPR